jgi:hypothetical protein
MRSPGPDLKALPEAHETAGEDAGRNQSETGTGKPSSIPATSQPQAAASSWNELHASTPYPDSTS